MTTSTVSVLASPHALWREEALLLLRRANPDLVVVRHELATIHIDGCVHRTVSSRGTVDTALPVDERCCLSCLLRDDTLAVLARLAADPNPADVLLVLPPAVEPANVATALADAGYHLDAIVVAVDASRLEHDLLATEPLATADALPDDPRTHAEVTLRQLRHADVVVPTGVADRSGALLEAIAPCAAIVHPTTPPALWLGTGRHDASGLRDQLRAGATRPRASVAREGVTTARWRRRRPLHPQRLLNALDGGSLHGTVTAHGHLWVATRPGTVVEVEVGADGCELLAVDPWPAAVPDAAASQATARPRTSTDTHRHPDVGDRVQEVIVVTLDRDVAEVVAVLDRCLLTDDEVAQGEPGWRSWPDPFRSWLGDEPDPLTPPSHPSPSDQEPS